jgi:hypothetical protein
MLAHLIGCQEFLCQPFFVFFIIFGLGTQIVGHSQVTLLGYLTQIGFGLL